MLHTEKQNHEFWMRKAIEFARIAYAKNEVPVGAVVVKDNQIIGQGYNLVNSTNIVSNHAEFIAINMASKKLKNWRLLDCEMYVTLEPCLMCIGAINNCRIKTVIYGSKNNNFGAIDALNSRTKLVSGVLQLECSKLLSDFFKKMRTNSKAYALNPKLKNIGSDIN